jgi:hypothetical protein
MTAECVGVAAVQLQAFRRPFCTGLDSSSGGLSASRSTDPGGFPISRINSSLASRCPTILRAMAYVAYAEAQLKKMLKGKALHSKGGTYNGKFGAHLVRLLHAGIALASTGEVMVRVSPELARLLLQIRSGELSMGHVLDMTRPLLQHLKHLSTTNAFPESPAFEAVNELVINARLSRNVS